VLKSQMKELLEAEKANAPSIEEEIEAERAKVDARTPITEEVNCRCLGSAGLAGSEEMTDSRPKWQTRGRIRR
jgi:hypothetical protein